MDRCGPRSESKDEGEENEVVGPPMSRLSPPTMATSRTARLRNGYVLSSDSHQMDHFLDRQIISITAQDLPLVWPAPDVLSTPG
ncbi:hypothetical protein J6590_000105 [Homalodisca vitripennis]|nr:hypothetical protein J6590_000105 [Homalodisca vitripennis]